jgi:hypothetical protein
LVKSVDVSNLSLVPPGSAVVVDWGYLLGHLGGNASLVVEPLEPLLKGGDLVVVAVPSPDKAPAAFNALAVAWARRTAANSRCTRHRRADSTRRPSGTDTT